MRGRARGIRVQAVRVCGRPAIGGSLPAVPRADPIAALLPEADDPRMTTPASAADYLAEQAASGS